MVLERIFVPEVYRRLQDYSEFYLDVEGTKIQSPLVGSSSTDIWDRGEVSSVAHKDYNGLEKLLFKSRRFYETPYQLEDSQIEAKERKLKLASTVDCFDDIVLFVPLPAPTASWSSSGFPNINVLLK